MVRGPLVPAVIVVSVIAASGQPRAQAQPQTIVGAWTLNKDKSELPPSGGDQDGREGGGRNGQGGGGRRGGGGRGGFGGGFGGGGFGGGNQGARPNPEDMQRRMAALRDILQPPDRLTITRTDTMVIVTAGDGRTTRLATDGSKVKDDSTGIERRTRWQGDKLVSVISGAASAKITETYTVDPESHQLTVTLQTEGGNRQSSQQGQNNTPQNGQGRYGNQHRVYDLMAQ
jgi:hypothetical protein